ncbi:MAG: N-acetylmuramidase family protein [Hyphomonadaceae bacterium]
MSEADINAAAERLGVDADALKTVIRVESAGPGFSADGRPLLSFEPFAFSQATEGRFDASNPGVSSSSNRAYIGGNQAARWQKLDEAYGLDPAAALGAASWGAFQLPGRYYAQAGYPNVFAFVQDLSHSEERQLAAFEAYLRNQSLVDELQRRDWQAFARAYEGEFGAGQYASALARAYTQIAPPSSDGYLESLRPETTAALTRADFEVVAQSLGCEVEAVQAVVEVESGSLGAFGADGRLVILFEPHIFSRQTNRQYDTTHPNLSYRSWDPSKYPRGQDARWDQLRQAYALDPEAAMASASYGLFQIMGFNHNVCGFPSAKAFVADMAKSQARQLAAFGNFVRGNNLADELQRKDWEGFARVYNGSGQVERYGRLMREAYERLTGTS